MPRTIDATPTWAGLMPALIALIENGTDQGREKAVAELMRLAAAADSFIAADKARAAERGTKYQAIIWTKDREGNPVTVYLGEDAERPLAERVAKFLPRICGNYTLIDTRDYPLTGISPEFRGHISHLVMHAVNQRIDAHMEQINCHPMEIRRYYRRLDY